MTPEKLQQIISNYLKTNPLNPLNVGDLFQVDYYSYGYDRDRIIHTVIGYYQEFVQFKNTHGVILENPLRIVQEPCRKETIKLKESSGNLQRIYYRNLETQYISSPKSGPELVDLTNAMMIYFGSKVISSGVRYYNTSIFGKDTNEARKTLTKMRSERGFNSSDNNSK